MPRPRRRDRADSRTVRTLNFFTAVGDTFGAGVAGKEFSIALSAEVDVRLSIVPPASGDWRSRLSSLADVHALEALAAKPLSRHAASFVRGAPLARRWQCPDDWPRRTDGASPSEPRRGIFVGHVFCEFERLLPEEVAFLAEADVITTGSDWAAAVLRDHGLERAATVHQGVELELFSPTAGPVARPRDLEGKFLVFSGGKYEFRKGVDLTIAAFAAFAARHDDAVLLINAYNPWPWSQHGLAASKHFHFAPVERYPDDFARVLAINDISAHQVRILAPGPRQELAKVMAMSDCGVFPIRCEAGTNHFLMEFMASGRPAIATYSTGLTDIVRPHVNCLGLTPQTAVVPALDRPDHRRGSWTEPAMEDIVTALETLYDSETLRARLGAAAAADMRRFSWPCCATRLLEVIDHAELSRDV